MPTNKPHDALIDHLMAGTCCFAPSCRYCTAGRELWLAYQAECVAQGGRDAMQTVRHHSPEWADAIKSKALILINGEHGRIS